MVPQQQGPQKYREEVPQRRNDDFQLHACQLEVGEAGPLGGAVQGVLQAGAGSTCAKVSQLWGADVSDAIHVNLWSLFYTQENIF